MKVTSRNLICRRLPALKDNRAEAKELESKLREARDVNAAAIYRPGVYATMDWVACRLTKAGSAVWAFLFACDELELVSFAGTVDVDVLVAVSPYLA